MKSLLSCCLRFKKIQPRMFPPFPPSRRTRHTAGFAVMRAPMLSDGVTAGSQRTGWRLEMGSQTGGRNTEKQESSRCISLKQQRVKGRSQLVCGLSVCVCVCTCINVYIRSSLMDSELSESIRED